MADKNKRTNKLKARLPRGLADRTPAEIAATRDMIEKIRAVYDRYGFEPVETPAIEYTDALGKFLPDQDRPNEGVFSFQDDDEQWLSLRYDLTAPLARYVAERVGTENFVLPYRSYRVGWVFRNEKPGPGRFRQFMQFDADTVGSSSPAADAELCMMAADTMEALGIPRGSYVVKVNNRKLLDGVLQSIGLGDDESAHTRLTALRALDKFDRLGLQGVRDLLGQGRKDESGDFAKGAGLTKSQIEPLLRFLRFGEIYDKIQRNEFDEIDTHFPNPFLHPPVHWHEAGYEQRILERAELLAKVNPTNRVYHWSFGIDILGEVAALFEMNDTLAQGLNELAELEAILQSAGYVGVVRTFESKDGAAPADEPGINQEERVLIDPSVVRGLEYYTGPVFEVELTFPTGKDGTRFGSVGGGGRYDGLVSRFRGEPVPATGFSIGVSRLAAALQHLGKLDSEPGYGPVVVTVFDKDRLGDYQAMAAKLRAAGIRAELYLGNPKNLGNQLKYADKRNSPCVVIQGSDEKARGEVTIKDLIVGAELAKLEKGREEHLQKQAEAQISVAEHKLVEAVSTILNRHGIAGG
jgi:histidyl-tRNA synthetase